MTLDGFVHPPPKVDFHLLLNGLVQFLQCIPLEQLVVEKLARRAPDHGCSLSLTLLLEFCFLFVLPDRSQMVGIEVDLQRLVFVFDETLLMQGAYVFYFLDDLRHPLLRMLHLVEPDLSGRPCQRGLQRKVDLSELLHWKVVLQVCIRLFYPFQDAWYLTRGIL